MKTPGVLSLLALVAVEGRALAEPPDDLAALWAEAQLVAVGKVRAVEARAVAGGRRVVTEVQVELGERLKGEPLQVVTLLLPGGAAGGVVQVISGWPRFSPGEEVLLFLQPWAGRHRVVGWTRGKFRLLRAPGGEELAVREDGAILSVSALRAHGPVVAGADLERGGVRLGRGP